MGGVAIYPYHLQALVRFLASLAAGAPAMVLSVCFVAYFAYWELHFVSKDY